MVAEQTGNATDDLFTDDFPAGGEDRMRAFLRRANTALVRPGLGENVPPFVQRRWLDLSTSLLPMPPEVRRGRGYLAGVPGRLYVPANPRPGQVIVYLHGGGYVTGSSFAYRSLTAHLARAAEMMVYVPDYRRAPEHPFPAALDDILAFYRGLLRVGFSADKIAFVGDSAGAGLAVATALRLLARGERLPAMLALISPWLDLAMTGESLRTKAAVDPLLTEGWAQSCVRAYIGDQSPEHPEISPLYADLKGLPPVMIQSGSDDIGFSDATRFAERAAKAGVLLEFQRFPGLWHNFQMLAGLLPDADDALGDLATRILAEQS